MTTPNDAQNQVNANIVANGKGAITGPVLAGVLTTIIAAISTVYLYTTSGLTGIVVGNGSSAATAIAPGTGVSSALALNIGSAGGFVTNGGALGTPSSGTLTNTTGLSASSGLTGIVPSTNGGSGGLTGVMVANGSSPPTASSILSSTNGGTGGLTGLVVGNGSSSPTAIVPGTGVSAALAVNVGSAGSIIVNGGALGTPSSGVLTHASGLPASSGLTGIVPSANGGSGGLTGVMIANGSSSPTASPILASTNGGAGGLTGLVVGNGSSAPTAITPGTGVASALPVNVGTAGSLVVNGGALGTPSSGTLTNATGLNAATGLTGVTPVANGGNGTATPALTAGTGVGLTGTWPNYTISAGSYAAPSPTKTSNYSATLADVFIPCDASAGNVTITLLSPTTVPAGQSLIIEKVDGTAYSCTVAPAAGTVNSDSISYTLAVQYSTATFTNDHISNWAITSSYLPAGIGTYQYEPWKVTGFYFEWEDRHTVRFYGGCATYNQNAPNVTGEICLAGQYINIDFNSPIGVQSTGCTPGPGNTQTCPGGLDYGGFVTDSQNAVDNSAIASSGLGTITFASALPGNFASGTTINVDSEVMTYTYTNSTTLTITARAQFSTSAATHSSGATVYIVDSPNAGFTTSGPPTVNTAWYPYLIKGMFGGKMTSSVILSQAEFLSGVHYPSGFSSSAARQLPFGIVYVYNSISSFSASSSVCSGQTAPLGVPQFSGVHGWPAGATFDYSQENSCGGYTVQAATAGLGTTTFINVPSTVIYSNWSQPNGANLCAAQEMRSAKVKYIFTSTTGAGGLYIRSNGDNNNQGKLVASIAAGGTIIQETTLDLSAGNHNQAGYWQWAAPANTTVEFEITGCGAVTQ